MKAGGKVIGIVVILTTILIVLFGVQYNRQLEQQRTQTIAQLVSLPAYQGCRYDASTCPQSENNIVLPDISGIGIVLLGIILGLYLIRSDHTSRTILDELKTKRGQLVVDEKREIVYSVLTADEKKIVEAVRQQSGISQATLRLRTDMSKAKLSGLLKDLETRGLIKKVEDGKTNAVYLKREL